MKNTLNYWLGLDIHPLNSVLLHGGCHRLLNAGLGLKPSRLLLGRKTGVKTDHKHRDCVKSRLLSSFTAKNKKILFNYHSLQSIPLLCYDSDHPELSISSKNPIMNKTPSIWTNPLSLVLIFLALAWLFAIARYCSTQSDLSGAGSSTDDATSPVPNYRLLQEERCPLKLSESHELVANALLQQYFRLDSLNRFQEAIWRPNPRIDTTFFQQFEGSWETYVECIQTLQRDSMGIEEKIALIASNFPDNDCRTCAPYIGYIRFRVQNDDPATIVIRDSDRALFKFGAYGAIGDQISLIDLGPNPALLFSTTYADRRLTVDSTVIYDLDDFRPILTLERSTSNGGAEEAYLYETEGELYVHPNNDPYLPVDLALYRHTTVLSGEPTSPTPPETIYYRYQPESLKYVEQNTRK